jgi:hypothetical protein
MRCIKPLLLVLLLSSCNGSNDVPEGMDIIPARKLELILYDMQLADVYSLSVRADTTKNYGVKNQDSLSRYYNEILAHHGAGYDQFKKTIDWYKEHPAAFDSVYQNVLNKFSAEEEKLKYKKQ